MALAVSRRRPRARPLIIVLALLSVTLLAVDRAGDSAPTHPLRSAIRDSFASVGTTAHGLWPFGDSDTVRRLTAENARLQSQLDGAQGALAESADASRERDQLAGLLGLATPDNVPKVIARVTAVGTTNFNATVEIGKGSNSGIAVGMPVVTGQGLLGRVVQTSVTRATVLLITDTTSNVALRFSDAGDIGVGVGQGSGQALATDLIDVASRVKAGEIAVTSGMAHSEFPPGIPVARVISSTARPRDLRRDVRLAPLVATGRLDDVAVLQWKPDLP